MNDNLRMIELTDINVPDGSPITFDGKEIGRVVRRTEKGCLCIVNSDIVRSWMKSQQCTWSMEVIHE